MAERPVGISDIAVYVPHNVIDVGTIVSKRTWEAPHLLAHLERAVVTTGQKALRFPSPWEDTATMAAEAALSLLRSNPRIPPAAVRFLTVGTETSLDHSKPASSYVQGMLLQAGLALQDRLSSFQVQHACAGGTLAMLSVGALLMLGGREEVGLVMCSDIARYDAYSTAEITQGAGAVALLIERSPKLLELELATAGFCSRDVDDFFRPLGSATAKVRGSYSVKCYSENLEAAFLDHCTRRGEAPAKVLQATDFFVLHTPFHNMAEIALLRLVARTLACSSESARQFLQQRGFYSSVAPVARIGNIYSGSLYLCLVSLLADRYKVHGSGLAGRSVLMASYGSGNTMAVISGRVAAQAPAVISKWNIDRLLEAKRTALWEEYRDWMGEEPAFWCGCNGADGKSPDPRCFYLTNLRRDGYREYSYRPAVACKRSKRDVLDGLYRPVPVLG